MKRILTESKKAEFVSMDANMAHQEIHLISSEGRWNPRIKAYIVAAHRHSMNMTPEKIVELYRERGVGLQQDEFFIPFYATVNKFPMTFEKFLFDGSRKKSFACAKDTYVSYLYNRLYYAYYGRIGKSGSKREFKISAEHPESHTEGALREWYEFYVDEFNKKSAVDSLKADMQDLKMCMAVISSYSTIVEHVGKRMNDIFSKVQKNL